MSETVLLIASTPLTILLGAAIARSHGGLWHLVLIEDFERADDWRALLSRWRGTPFIEVECLPGRASEARAWRDAGSYAWLGGLRRLAIRRRQRQVVFARLAAIDADRLPAWVAVGNDRRPETQFALAQAARRGKARPGFYLDDGLFTYVGDVHARAFTRRWIDAPLKRLVWGRFWQPVAIAGTSPWIDRACLARPQRALDHDPQRQRLELPLAAFGERALLRLALAAWRQFAGGRPPRLHAVVALPHSDLLRGDNALLTTIGSTIRRLLAGGGTVAIKHHPREREPDPYGLVAAGAVCLPTALAFELLLPFLRRGAWVVGSASSALLAARYLRPDLVVVDLGGSGDFVRRASAFLQTEGVVPVTRLATISADFTVR